MRLLLSLLITLSLSVVTLSQHNPWYPAAEIDLSIERTQTRYSTPTHFELYRLDHKSLTSALHRAPQEREVPVFYSPLVVSLPMPDGTMRTYHMVQYDMMEMDLAAKFPHLRTYIGVDPTGGSRVHCTLSDQTFFAAIKDQGHTYYIDPYSVEDTHHYVVYDVKEDLSSQGGVHCHLEELVTPHVDLDPGSSASARGEPVSLRTYRLAVSADYTFVQHNGGTVASTMQAITTVVDRVNLVYETDVAIRFILVADNDELIFTEESTDPFRYIAIGRQEDFLEVNQITVDGVIESANYDVGHVLNCKGRGNSGEGIARRSSACIPGIKARGSTAMSSGGPSLNYLAVAVASHELGHQFSATHTMYHCINVEQSTAYEPGSGSTIMSYPGRCSPFGVNVQFHTDDYFHTNSVELIMDHADRSGCAQSIDLGNTTPDVKAVDPTRLYIPTGTAFRLTANATDMESDTGLTYCWEQYQTGIRDWETQPWDMLQPVGTEPLFRSYPPTSDPVRYFPALHTIVNNGFNEFELLPDYARRMQFRVTVRDHFSQSGGTSWDTYRFETHKPDLPGKFEITNFTTKDTLRTLGETTLTWDVWGTDLPPISTPYMDIYLSTDGGLTFPYLIMEGTPNDGSATLHIPNIAVDRARFMIVGHDQIFLVVSDRSAIIVRDSSQEVVKLTYQDQYLDVCAPDVLTLPISSTSLLGTFTGQIALDIQGLPDGVIYSFSDDYPALGEEVMLTLDFTDAERSSTDDLVITYTPDGMTAGSASLEMNVKVSTFDELALVAPDHDVQIATTFPAFEWTADSKASSYTLQVATSPTFAPDDLVIEVSDLEATSYQVTSELEPGQLHFWRVIPNNECGAFPQDVIRTFLITPKSCQEYCSTEPPISIITAANTYSMTIHTGSTIMPEDVNITKIRGRHTNFGHLRMSVQGPSGTDVWLLGPNVCSFSNTPLDMGFDDESVGVNFTCNNFDDGLRFKPRGALSSLSGIAGNEYTMTIEDNTNGGTGTWDGWCIELCGELSFSAPELITNEILQTNAHTNKTISSTHLDVSHPDYDADELRFTVVSETVAGDLLSDGIPVGVGDQFTMQDIQDGKISYTHTLDNVDADGFDFIVTAPNSGVLFTPRFEIRISSATNEHLPGEAEIYLYPNPTRDRLTIHLDSDVLSIDGIELFDAVGHLIQAVDSQGAKSLDVPVTDLASGMYFIKITADEYVITRKVMKM